MDLLCISLFLFVLFLCFHYLGSYMLLVFFFRECFLLGHGSDTGSFVVTFSYEHTLYRGLVHPSITPSLPLHFLKWLWQPSTFHSFPSHEWSFMVSFRSCHFCAQNLSIVPFSLRAKPKAWLKACEAEVIWPCLSLAIVPVVVCCRCTELPLFPSTPGLHSCTGCCTCCPSSQSCFPLVALCSLPWTPFPVTLHKAANVCSPHPFP